MKPRPAPGWWDEFPTVDLPQARGRVTAADLIARLHPAAQDFLADLDDWSMPMPSVMEKHKKLSGRVVLDHLNHAQEAMAQSLAGELEFDDDTFDAIVNYAVRGIFHLKAVLLVMSVLGEEMVEDE